MIAYSNRDLNEVWILHPSDNSRYRVVGGRDPTLSPDGQWLAYYSFNQGIEDGIYAINLTQNSQPVPILTSKVVDFDLAWSPEGSWLAFSSGFDPSIYLVRPNGSDLTRLTDNSGQDFGLSWSPNGDQLAYASNKDGDMEIYILDLATLQEIKLTENDFSDQEPAWSPDGSKIAFIREANRSVAIYTMNIDGTDIKKLRNERGVVLGLIWSPDGNHIAYLTNHGNGLELYIMRRDGSNSEHFVEGPLDFNFSWVANNH
jgi:TolB protein